jgi:WD repeat-containing protein 68
LFVIFRIHFDKSSDKRVFLVTDTKNNNKSAQKMSGSSGKRKEIYKYVAPFNLYSMNWSVRPDKRFRLALGSFVEEYNNKVQIISLDEDTSEFSAKSTFDHPYPTTKIMWIPDSKGIFPDLLATSGDYLRIWRAGEPETRMECVLNNNKNSGECELDG